MKPIPEELLPQPFTRSRAIELGVTPKMLRGNRFERMSYEVYRVASGPATRDDRLAAARLAMPERAYLTGISRIQEIGLDYGPQLPLRFVIEGDHHLAIPEVFLHRTKLLPPLRDGKMSAEGAFISYCSLARVIDAIKVGDWLLHHGHMTLERLIEVAAARPWRAGAYEALFIANHLTADSRSIRESETAALLVFAGLPRPEFNVTLEIAERVVIGDLVYLELRLVIEYEGRHHQEERDQYNSDIDRYKVMRGHDYRYLQITDERIARPRRMVRSVHEEMVQAGYAGPAPSFGESWRVLFARASAIVGRNGPGDKAA